jgi:uncharacterized damage-inducible protein DinB
MELEAHKRYSSRIVFSSLEEALDLWTRQSAITRRVIAALPDSGYATRPHPKSRTGAELAWHIATDPYSYVTGNLKLKVKGQPALGAPGSPDLLLIAFDAIRRDCLAAVGRQDDAWLKAETRMDGRAATNGFVLWSMVLHEVHHRGQLGLYIRMAGGKVPWIAGPTADDAGPPPPPKPRRK